MVSHAKSARIFPDELECRSGLRSGGVPASCSVHKRACNFIPLRQAALPSHSLLGGPLSTAEPRRHQIDCRKFLRAHQIFILALNVYIDAGYGLITAQFLLAYQCISWSEWFRFLNGDEDIAWSRRRSPKSHIQVAIAGEAQINMINGAHSIRIHEAAAVVARRIPSKPIIC